MIIYLLSYQLSVKTLKAEGYNISEIENIFKKSVSVAKALLRTKKILKYWEAWTICNILADGSEYTGVYNTKDETIRVSLKI